MNAPEDPNGLREALARAVEAGFDNGIRHCGDGNISVDAQYDAALADAVEEALAAALAPGSPLASLIAERDALSCRRRWNVEERDGDMVAICHGHHDRSDDCDWIEYVLLASLRAAEAEITRLTEGMEALGAALDWIADGRPGEPHPSRTQMRSAARQALATLSPKEQT